MIAAKIIGAPYGTAGLWPACRRDAGGPIAWRRSSSVGGLKRELLRDFAFPAVAVREKLHLVVEQLLTGLGGELQIRPFDDRIDRAGLLAIAAVDAFGHVDVI